MIPWSEANLYETFTRNGILPETVRNMPVYDVYMILYARLADFINNQNRDQPTKKLGDNELNNLLSKGQTP